MNFVLVLSKSNVTVIALCSHLIIIIIPGNGLFPPISNGGLPPDFVEAKEGELNNKIHKWRPNSPF